MRVPKVHGVIKRRLLVNFRVDPSVVARHLPAPFRPKLQSGCAIAGICLIRLEDIRPRRFPRLLGLSSENAAHRIAVTWDDHDGSHEGVYIPRRDTGSVLNHVAGGRLFPGEHHRAVFQVEDTGGRIRLEMTSADGKVRVEVVGHPESELPRTSVFATIEEASAFFEPGSVGYSATAAGSHLDQVVLTTRSWHVAPLAIEHVRSSYFDDTNLFPAGSVAFDCALVMRNIAHEWQAGAPMYM